MAFDPSIVSSGQKITLTCDSSAISSDQTDFPLTVILDGTDPLHSALFSDLGVNYKKLSIESGSTQLPIEIECWDDTAETATLHTKVPTYTYSADPVLTLSYDSTQDDNTYVGDTGDTIAQTVWDSSFAAVYHLAQDPSTGGACILDSTSAGLDLTPYNMDSSNLVDTSEGKGLVLNGTDEYLGLPVESSLALHTTLTLEAKFAPTTLLNATTITDAYAAILSRQTSGVEDSWVLAINGTSGCLHFGSFGGNAQGTQDSWAADTDYVIAATYNSSGYVGELFVDGASETLTNDSLESMTTSSAAVEIGRRGSSDGWFLPATISEIRVSSIVRSDDWLKLTHLSLTDQLITFSAYSSATAIRAIFDQVYDLERLLVRTILDQVYHLTTRQVNILIQVYGFTMLATLIQPYGDMPKRRALLDQMYGDNLQVRRLLDQMYGDMPSYRAEFDQQWVMLQDLRADLVQSYHLAADQVRAIFDAIYGLPEHDRVVALLDQLYVLAAGEAIVQQTAISIVVMTDGIERDITSAYNINIEQDDSIYHMTGELQLAGQEDYLFCRSIGPGVVPSTVTVTIDGDTYEYIVERTQKARTTEGIAYAVVLASKTLLLGHKHAAESSVDETMISGMAQTIVEALAADVCMVDWRLVDWYIPANRLYVNGRRRIEVIRQIVEAVGGILQSSPAGTLICRPEYPVDVDQWQQTTQDIELADQDNFFSIMPSADPRDGYNRFFVADQQLGESGERIDDEQVSTYERHVMVWYVPWADISGMRLHHSGGPWISVVENGSAVETVEEQIEIVDGQGRVSKPCYGDITVAWLQQDLGAVSIEEDGTVTTEIAGNSLVLISYTTRYFSYNVRGDRVEDVQVYPEVIA